jgi:hypothetical protein
MCLACAYLSSAVPYYCDAASISIESDLDQLRQRHCNTIQGALVITNLDPAISEYTLRDAFGNVATITGGLVVVSNPSLIALDFLASLSIAPSVRIQSNDALVDARLPRLNTSATITIDGNRRLCPLNYPLAAGTCSLIDVTTSIALTGALASELSQSELDRVLSAIAIATNISIEQVL